MVIDGAEIRYEYWVVVLLQTPLGNVYKDNVTLIIDTQTAVEDELEEMLIDKYGEDYVGIVDFECRKCIKEVLV